MRYSNKLIILLTLSTIALILVGESHKTIPSKEEKEEMKKLLTYLNKPAVKSFQTEHGYIFDCIDIQKQLAFDHPLLKNHSIKLKPTTIPKWTKDNNASHKTSSLPFRQDDISCPVGTVIVKRIILEDLIQAQRLKSLGFNYPGQVSAKDKKIDLTGHHFATISYKDDHYGAKGNINVWNPNVSPDQFSLAAMAVSGNKGFQSISAGWIVYPGLNQNNQSHLFTYWTADGNNKTHCYNTLCPGFVHVSTKYAIGMLAQPVSIYDGQQYQLEVSIYQDHVTRDWWFVLNNEPIGYWPKSLFTRQGLADGASAFATADYDYDNVAGVTGNINLWDPQVSHDQVSLATMAIAGGPKIEQLASISVGWMVNPLLYQDHIHLYTYWTSLFIASGLVKGADLASWGGQVYSPKTEKSPIMGSGHFPKEGFGKAAFVNNIHIMNGKGEALIPQIYTIETHESSPNCYKAKFVHDEDEPWIRAVYFGESRGQILLEDDENELDRLLNYINKPPIKSFQTENGDILDCIDIHKQLAFDHPQLKNHSIQYKYSHYGARGNLNLWEPEVSPTQFSLASMLISSGLNEQFQGIRAGWIDHITGNWWLMAFNNYVGYWPNSLFTDVGLAHGASLVSWGGEVYSPVKEKSPSMGSGHFPQEGFKKAAYVSGIELIEDIKLEGSMGPPLHSLKTVSSTPNCYKAIKKPGMGELWANAIFFGGPGGCTF
ncbi:putative neprosin [Arabidopsis thaliana]